MPPPKPKRSQLAGTKATGSPGAGALPAENPQKKALEAARKSQVTIPPREVFDNYKLGGLAQDLYDLIVRLEVEGASSSGIYTLLGRKIPSLEYVADFQTEVRDAIQGALRALQEKRRLPRAEILRHVFAGLIFFAPKEVIPLLTAAQVVAQETMYAKWNPLFMDEFPMRDLSMALGHSIAILQLSGSVGVNPHYTHSPENLETVLRGLGEGIKSSSLAVAGTFTQAMANLQRFQQGIEDGYNSIKKEYFARTAAGLLGRFMKKQ